MGLMRFILEGESIFSVSVVGLPINFSLSGRKSPTSLAEERAERHLQRKAG